MKISRRSLSQKQCGKMGAMWHPDYWRYTNNSY